MAQAKIEKWHSPSWFRSRKGAQDWQILQRIGGVLTPVVNLRVAEMAGGLKVWGQAVQAGEVVEVYVSAGYGGDRYAYSRAQVEAASKVLAALGLAPPSGSGLIRNETHMVEAGFYLSAPTGGVWPSLRDIAALRVKGRHDAEFWADTLKIGDRILVDCREEGEPNPLLVPLIYTGKAPGNLRGQGYSDMERCRERGMPVITGVQFFNLSDVVEVDNG